MAKKPATQEIENSQPEQEVVKAVKAFTSDLKCNGFQYEVGKTYEITGKLEICRNGFHACDENPLDVWNFYPVVDDDGKLNRYATTTHTGGIQNQKDETHSKIASAKITVDVELSFPDFIRKAVAWVIDATKGIAPDTSSSERNAQIGSSGDSAQIGSSGYYAQIGSSGDYAQIGSSGYYAKIGSSGDYAQIGSSGDSAQIGSSGDSAQIGSSGYYAQIGSSGDSAQIGSSGYYAQIGSSGDSAKIGSSGDSAKITAEGKDAVVASAGPGTTVSAAEGAWISIAEFNDDGKCIGFATGCIGQDGLESGVRYRAKGGKLIAA